MSRAQALLAAIALAAGAVAVAFTWQPGLASLYDDSVSYLLLAQAAAPYGDAGQAVRAAAALEKYPPLLGWLIAFTGGAFDWRFAHALVAIAFGASVLLLGLHVRNVSGNAAVGAAAALAYALMPGAWLNVKGILSEFPYMAMSFGALAWHAARRDRPMGTGEALGLGILLATAVLTRTIGAALVAAIAAAELARFLRDRDRSRLRAIALLAGVPAAALAAWYLLRPAGGEDAYAAFGAQVAQGAARDGLAFAANLAIVNAAALRDAWLNALLVFWGEGWRPGYLLAVAIGAVGLATLAVRGLRGEADGLYVGAFLAILLAWPFPGQMYRLALPVAPLLLAAFLLAWLRLLERWKPVAATRRAALAALLPIVLCAPATLFYIAPRAAADDAAGHPRKSDIAEFFRIPSGRAAEASALAQIGVLEDLRRIGETTPVSARVMWYWPNYVALLAGREGVRLERPRDAGDLAAQARRAGATHLYLGELHPRDSARRDGDPLAPLADAATLGEVVWQRNGASGTIRGVLIAFDPARLAR